jgi:hypothetical protein
MIEQSESGNGQTALEGFEGAEPAKKRRGPIPITEQLETLAQRLVARVEKARAREAQLLADLSAAAAARVAAEQELARIEAARGAG